MFNTARNIRVKHFDPSFEISLEVKNIQDFVQVLPFDRIESFLKVKEKGDAMCLLCFGVVNNNRNESNIFANVSILHVTSLIWA